MGRSGLLVAALLGGFVVYTLARGDIGEYVALLIPSAAPAAASGGAEDVGGSALTGGLPGAAQVLGAGLPQPSTYTTLRQQGYSQTGAASLANYGLGDMGLTQPQE